VKIAGIAVIADIARDRKSKSLATEARRHGGENGQNRGLENLKALTIVSDDEGRKLSLFCGRLSPQAKS
jgi:hypothetical protein